MVLLSHWALTYRADGWLVSDLWGHREGAGRGGLVSGNADVCLTSESRCRPVGRRSRSSDFSWFK